MTRPGDAPFISSLPADAPAETGSTIKPATRRNLPPPRRVATYSAIKPYLAALAVSVRAEPGTNVSGATAAQEALPALPWHLVNLRWQSAAVTDFRQFSIDVDISQAVSAESYNLDISTRSGHINGNFYSGGIQTDVNGRDQAKLPPP